MIAKAEAKYVRMSARKTRLVTALIKGKSIEKANFILDNTNKRAAVPVKKVLKSAFSNANNGRQEKFLERDLTISLVRVDGGPLYKRYRAATMGRATSIKHRTVHICLGLEETKTKVKEKKATARAPKKIKKVNNKRS
ncbi:MAG: 50S ribosomal protein L22 [Candidatus Omnitrophota bacterium]